MFLLFIQKSSLSSGSNPLWKFSVSFLIRWGFLQRRLLSLLYSVNNVIIKMANSKWHPGNRSSLLPVKSSWKQKHCVSKLAGVRLIQRVIWSLALDLKIYLPVRKKKEKTSALSLVRKWKEEMGYTQSKVIKWKHKLFFLKCCCL